MSGRKILKRKECEVETHFHRVNVEEAKSYDEYWHVVKNIFQEQAARVIHKAWRKHKKLPSINYAEALTNNASMLCFLQEPQDNKASEHADRINDGSWVQLDYNDPEFVRNIFKALRLTKINRKQMSTALLLYEAQFEYSGQIRQHSFSKPGPYQPANILYASKDALMDFQRRLQLLPTTEQCYFSVDFSKYRERLFLCGMLTKMPLYPKLHSFLKVYVSKSALTDAEKKSYYQAIQNLSYQVNAEDNRTEFLHKLSPAQAFTANKANAENRYYWCDQAVSMPEHKANISFLANHQQSFNAAYNAMYNLIHSDLSQNKFHSAKYYILAYRLRSHVNGLSLCNDLNKVEIDNFLAWTRNSGLRIIGMEEEGEIAKLSASQLYTHLARPAKETQQSCYPKTII